MFYHATTPWSKSQTSGNNFNILMEKIFWDEDGWPLAGTQSSPSCDPRPAPLSDEEATAEPDFILTVKDVPVTLESSDGNGCVQVKADGSIEVYIRGERTRHARAEQG